MDYKLSELIDIEKTRGLIEGFSSVVGIPAAIIDLEGKALVTSPWQRVCADFHRQNGVTCQRCIQSDTTLANELLEGKTFSLYRCPNGLTDAASPIIIEGTHLANAFVGQFLTEKPDLEFFRSQAGQFDFDESSYLEAVSEVPIVSKEALPSILSFLSSFAEMTAGLGLRQSRQMEAERELREARLKLQMQNEQLRAGRQDMNRAQAVSKTGSWRLNIQQNVLDWSKEACRIFGVPGGAPLTYELFLARVHPEDREMVDERWQAALSGEAYDVEHRIVVDGAVKWVRERAVLEFDGGGALCGGFGTVQDVTERKLADAELKRSREWFRVTLGSIGDAVIATDTKGLVTFINPVGMELTGWKLGEAVGQPVGKVFRIINEITRQPAENIVEKVLREGSIVNLANHTSLLTRDGREIPIEDSAAPIRDDSGNICGVVLVFHDVTEQRRAREAIVRAKEEWEYTFRSIPDLIAILDDRHRVVRVNPAMAERVGLTPDECVGAPCYKVVHGTDSPPAFCPHTRTLQDGGEHRVEMHQDRLGGHFLVTTSPILDAEGVVIGSVHVARDFTEQKELESELRKAHAELESRVLERTAQLAQVNRELMIEMEARKRAAETVKAERQRFYDVLETLPVYVCLLTPDYHVPFVNRVFRERFGKSEDLRCFEHLFGRGEPCEVCHMNKVLQTMTPLEWERTGPDNREYTVFDFPFRDTDGSSLILEMGIDITERKKAETELAETVKRLELINTELQDFAFVAAHDLQEPLRKIQIFCDMAVNRCGPALDSAGREYLHRVLNSANRMRQLLRDLLAFSRVASRPEPFRKLDLGEVAREAAEVFEASLKETGCRVEIEDMPVIEADESQLLQLFQNLIGNALKYRGNETPLIRVHGKAFGQGACEICVEDNGIGFDPRFAERIFKPFQRLHGRGQYEGTGMGLAICRKIVERHGGAIRAEGKPGKGAKFIARLPMTQNRPASVIVGQ